jgi:hypothetical protein
MDFIIIVPKKEKDTLAGNEWIQVMRTAADSVAGCSDVEKCHQHGIRVPLNFFEQFLSSFKKSI